MTLPCVCVRESVRACVLLGAVGVRFTHVGVCSVGFLLTGPQRRVHRPELGWCMKLTSPWHPTVWYLGSTLNSTQDYGRGVGSSLRMSEDHFEVGRWEDETQDAHSGWRLRPPGTQSRGRVTVANLIDYRRVSAFGTPNRGELVPPRRWRGPPASEGTERASRSGLAGVKARRGPGLAIGAWPVGLAGSHPGLPPQRRQ